MKFQILILEDNKPQADRIKYLLENRIEEDLGITVKYGADKETVMKRFDIAIIDLNMPYLDSEFIELDENAGQFAIDSLVNCNPDIYIIIRTSIECRGTIANACNSVERGCLKFIEKEIRGEAEYEFLIREIKALITDITKKYPHRIDYGKLTYIHGIDETYESNDWRSYKRDKVYIDNVLIKLPSGGQKAALYKYLVNRGQWLDDRTVLEFSGYNIDGLWSEEVAKHFKDNITKHFKFLRDAELNFEYAYGKRQHRIILKEELRN